MDFIGKIFDGLKFICGYLISLCSIILVLIIFKTGYASKSLVWVWGVTDHLRNKPIFLKPISKPPFFALSWHLIRGHLFLLSMGRNIIHPLKWNEEKGLLQDPKTHAPHSKKDFKVSSFLFLCFWQICWFYVLLRAWWWDIVTLLFFFSCWNFEHCMIGLKIFVWSCCALCFGAFLNCWVIWYHKIWTMLKIHEALHCM